MIKVAGRYTNVHYIMFLFLIVDFKYFTVKIYLKKKKGYSFYGVPRDGGRGGDYILSILPAEVLGRGR